MDSHNVSRDLPEPDVRIVTSGGSRIPAHSGILASVSPVLENILDRHGNRKQHRSEKVIPIVGVPSDAVSVFIEFLYSSRLTDDQIEKYGIHLLALSHVYLVPQLKQRCIKGLTQLLKIDNVIDVLQLARLCDAPDLYLKCMNLVNRHFKSVEKTEGWEFLQENDPWLELDVLQFIDEAELRKRRRRRQKKEQSLYLQFSEAMECLEHICREGCTCVGPYDMKPGQKKRPCSHFSTCQGLQLLIKHFMTCEKRVKGGCCRCKRMWQILKLHSSICDQPDTCRVPLCRQFKLRALQDKKGKDIDDIRWKLLVKKVVSAKTISSLCAPKTKNEQEKLQEETCSPHIKL